MENVSQKAVKNLPHWTIQSTLSKIPGNEPADLHGQGRESSFLWLCDPSISLSVKGVQAESLHLDARRSPLIKWLGDFISVTYLLRWEVFCHPCNGPSQKWRFLWGSSYTNIKKKPHQPPQTYFGLGSKREQNQNRQNQVQVWIQQWKSLAICSEIWGAPDVSWKLGLIFLMPAGMRFLWRRIVNFLLLSQDHMEVHHELKESSCNGSLVEFIAFCLDSISRSLWP